MWTWVLLSGQIAVGAEHKIRVLIFSGANNHNWNETTPELERILKRYPIFQVDTTYHPETITADQVAKVDVIVSNWNNFNNPEIQWPITVRQVFVDFLKNGGGHVTIHAGGSSHNGWAEYHHITAYWGDGTNHGPYHEFTVKPTEDSHPITQGIEPFEAKDELWNNTCFPPRSTPLMTAFSMKDKGGTGKDEPVLAVNRFGKGRCVNLMLGHDGLAMKNPGFEALLSHSVEWAGAGTVKSTTKLKTPSMQKNIEN